MPAGSVVVAGSLPSGEGRCQLYCAVIVKQVDAKTRAKTSINELLRAERPHASMSVAIKSAEDIEKMRVAGRLAAELLDYLTPHVQPGVTTGELDRFAHDYQVNVQQVVPATLNYAPPGHRPYPASICTSVNHVVCHGIPGDKKLKPGDIVNIDVTVIKDGWHGDTSRMFYVGHAVDPGEAPGRDHLRGDVARHPRGPARARTSATSATRSRRSPRATTSRSCASSAATASAGSSTRSRRCCTTGAPGTGLKLAAGDDLHRSSR